MGSNADKAPLIVILGETASGKSELALRLARQFDGEIVAADSRTLYRGMDIGTAKPSLYQRQMVNHHLIDIANPDQPFTAADFKLKAMEAIEDISSRSKVPFLVGGTGLYIDAVLYDFSFNQKGDNALREQWQRRSPTELQEELKRRGIPLPTNEQNPRHLMRQLETGGDVAEKRDLRSNTLIIGLQVEKTELTQRITKRVDLMFKLGLESEVRYLVDAYSWECPSLLQTIGYQEFKPFYSKNESLSDIRTAIIKNTLSYAKRQRTWFKRNKSIHWICEQEEAVDFMTAFLNK